MPEYAAPRMTQESMISDEALTNITTLVDFVVAGQRLETDSVEQDSESPTQSRAIEIETSDDAALFAIRYYSHPENLITSLSAIEKHDELEIFVYEDGRIEVNARDLREQDLATLITGYLKTMSQSDEVTQSHQALNWKGVGHAEQTLYGNDVSLIDEKQKLFAVFDGAGKDPLSHEAAQTAAHTIQEFVAQSEQSDPHQAAINLVRAIEHAHVAILQKEPGEAVTTATIAQLIETEGRIDQAALAWASVGDSRLYLRNGREDQRLVQVSHDEGHRNVLENAIGGSARTLDKVVQFGLLKLVQGSEVILVTDGITGDKPHQSLSVSDLEETLGESGDAQEAADNLLAASRKNDDKTTIVVRY